MRQKGRREKSRAREQLSKEVVKEREREKERFLFSPLFFFPAFSLNFRLLADSGPLPPYENPS